MADRFSPRKLITLSMIANGLLGFWLATIPSFKVLLAIQLLMGVFLTLTYWSALIKMVRQLATSDQQGRYFGILEAGRNLGKQVTCRSEQGVQQTTHLGVRHFLQGRFIANDQGRSLQLQQLPLLEISEKAADRLARSANHLRDFFMRER